jgi:hypothetical protein
LDNFSGKKKKRFFRVNNRQRNSLASMPKDLCFRFLFWQKQKKRKIFFLFFQKVEKTSNQNCFETKLLIYSAASFWQSA